MTKPHPILEVEVTTWELERLLDALTHNNDLRRQEREDLIKDIKGLLARVEEK